MTRKGEGPGESALLPHLDIVHDHRAVVDLVALRPRRVPLVLALRKIAHSRCTHSQPLTPLHTSQEHLLSDPSNHGFPPALSGNHPFVPPTATFIIR